MKYGAIVIGVSSGGMNAMKILFSILPKGFLIPIVIVQHVSPHSDSQWIKFLNDKSEMYIKEADEKESIKLGTAYIAPPNYHLLIESDNTFSLTIDKRVNYARPSIDVLFESAAEVYKNKLIGVVLTGANNDGTNGIKKIKEYGGIAIIQDPETAESTYMPLSAIAAIKPDHILSLEEIANVLMEMSVY